MTLSSASLPFEEELLSGFLAEQYGHFSTQGLILDNESLSAKRRKKLSILVPYPRLPRSAEFQCSNCSHSYSRVVADNPWWAVYHHSCPSCHMNQVPRIDITKESNAIEADPNVMALYGEGVDDSADEADDDEEVEDVSLDDADDKSSLDEYCSSSFFVNCFDCEGQFALKDASKLLVLMRHAKTCCGYHSSAKLASVCSYTKYMMLHLRDCKCKHSDCIYSWCDPSKIMIQHISSCADTSICQMCTPKHLSTPFLQLHSLNQSNI